MAASNAVIVISNLVDANVRSYQPDLEFYLYRSIDGLAETLNSTPIRAKQLYFTRDAIGQSNASFTYLAD